MFDIRIYLSALVLLIGAIVYPLAHDAAKTANESRDAQTKAIMEVTK